MEPNDFMAEFATFTTEMQKILRTAYQILTIYTIFSNLNGIIHFQIEDKKTIIELKLPHCTSLVQTIYYDFW